MRGMADALLDSYRPSLVPVGEGVVAAVFPLMNIFPTEFCVRAAREAGVIGPTSLVVESASGTMALGLALVCRWRCQPLTIVTDAACDAILRRRLENSGPSSKSCQVRRLEVACNGHGWTGSTDLRRERGQLVAEPV